MYIYIYANNIHIYIYIYANTYNIDGTDIIAVSPNHGWCRPGHPAQAYKLWPVDGSPTGPTIRKLRIRTTSPVKWDWLATAPWAWRLLGEWPEESWTESMDSQTVFIYRWTWMNMRNMRLKTRDGRNTQSKVNELRESEKEHGKFTNICRFS